MINDDSTLGEVKEWLHDRVPEGIECPACHQNAQIYRRPLHSGMVRALIHIYKHRDADDKFNITTHRDTNKGDTSKLRFWGLIEQDEEDKRRGVWRITHDGKLFVERRMTVPGYAEIYDGELLKIDGDPITIRDALGKKFDYVELMRTTATTDGDEVIN